MPSRVIRGEFVSSRSMLRVSIQARHTFSLLILTVDDYGRYDGRMQILLSALYPGGDVKSKQLEEWLRELANEGCVRFYSVAGADYIHLPQWEAHRGNQRRANSSRYPDPRDAIQAIPGDPGTSPEIPPRGGGGVGDGGGETPSCRSRLTVFPDDIGDGARAELREWALNRGIDDAFLGNAIEACRDWALGKGAKKADWVATIRNWLRRAWVDAGNELLDPDWRDDLDRTRFQIQLAVDAVTKRRPEVTH